jgi:hypothetical protein
MKIKALAIGAMFALATSSAFANQISGGTVTMGPTPTNYPNPIVDLTFNQFAGCMGCTLTGIEIDLTANVTSQYTVMNTNSSNTEVLTVKTSAQIDINDTADSTIYAETLPSHTVSYTLPASGSTTGTDLATSFEDEVYTGSGSGSFANASDTPLSCATLDALDLSGMGCSPTISSSPFLGSGTVALEAFGQFLGGGVGPNNTTAVIGQGAETVTVLYDYTVTSGTPEPSTMALFGSALIGLGIVFRKRRSTNA